MERKAFIFELKKLEQDGTFEGYAATFGKVDRVNDFIERGAFKRSLSKQNKFPLHWYHDVRIPVGEVFLQEDYKGLKTVGQLLLETQKARELYHFMKETETVARQLSIGYEAVKKEWDGDVRILKEIKLHEVSIVTFGADQEAVITNVKAEFPRQRASTLKIDFCDQIIEGLKELNKFLWISKYTRNK